MVNHQLYAMGARAYRAADVELDAREPLHHGPQAPRPPLRAGPGPRPDPPGALDAGGPVLNREELGRIGLAYLPKRLAATASNVRRWGGPELQRQFRRVRPLVAAGADGGVDGAVVRAAAAGPGKLRTADRPNHAGDPPGAARDRRHGAAPRSARYGG